MDETWVHRFTPQANEQSKQWTKWGESAPKKAKTVPSAGKVMASVFWDACGIIFIDYLLKGKTINGEYYANLLQRLSDEIKKKGPHLAKKKVFARFSPLGLFTLSTLEKSGLAIKNLPTMKRRILRLIAI